jgi:hypothetical protein
MSSSGRPYYFNISTGETSWNYPLNENIISESVSPPVSPSYNLDTPPVSPSTSQTNWVSRMSSSGLPYYFNISTGETSWNYPLNKKILSDTDTTPVSPSYNLDTPPVSPSYNLASPPLSPSYNLASPPLSPSYNLDTPPISPSYNLASPPLSPSYNLDTPPVSPGTPLDTPPTPLGQSTEKTKMNENNNIDKLMNINTQVIDKFNNNSMLFINDDDDNDEKNDENNDNNKKKKIILNQ